MSRTLPLFGHVVDIAVDRSRSSDLLSLGLDSVLDFLNLLLGLLLQLGSGGQSGALLGLVVHEDTAALDNTDHTQEEVDSSKSEDHH